MLVTPFVPAPLLDLARDKGYLGHGVAVPMGRSGRTSTAARPVHLYERVRSPCSKAHLPRDRRRQPRRDHPRRREGRDPALNKGAERVFRFTAEEAIGQTIDIIIPERLARAALGRSDRTMATGKSRYAAGECWRCRPSPRTAGASPSSHHPDAPRPRRRAAGAGRRFLRDVTICRSRAIRPRRNRGRKAFAASEMTMSASNSLAAASSRLLIFTVSPIAVTPIAVPKPMEPTMAGPTWMPIATWTGQADFARQFVAQPGGSGDDGTSRRPAPVGSPRPGGDLRPNSAIAPSPMNLSSRPPAFSTASPTIAK